MPGDTKASRRAVVTFCMRPEKRRGQLSDSIVLVLARAEIPTSVMAPVWTSPWSMQCSKDPSEGKQRCARRM
eukprot:2185559-Rhodomonas_salina.1